mgnify:CR=1 FL=1
MIYIVEDDAAIRELEQYALQSSGYEVQSFETSEPFWQAMRTAEPELVILDVMLPGEDGFSILKKLRNTPALRRLPIIMVTAKSSELDTVRGLDCGADDYITKPFGIMEFLSRVRAALRRSAPEGKQNVYAFHEILLDNARHSVTVNGTHIDLTYKEYSLLRLLLENKQIAPSRIIAAGRGESLPVDPAKTSEARAKNRRTEIILTPKLDELMQLMKNEE